VARYEDLANPPLRQSIGEALVDLDASRVRTEETNLGNFIADIMRQTAQADAAIINGGSIKGSIAKGTIKMQDVYNALPYDNYLIAIQLTGAQLKETLEHGVSQVGKPSHRFPQVSGLTFTYSRSAPAGSRLKAVIVGGQPLNLTKKYLVATIDYLGAGGDGFKIFSDALERRDGGKMERIVYTDTGNWLRDRVIIAIKAQKTIAPQVDGRIKAVD
jgi:5'-nucleotidase/UDP-sugar diphosphatase